MTLDAARRLVREAVARQRRWRTRLRDLRRQRRRATVRFDTMARIHRREQRAQDALLALQREYPWL